MATKFSALPLPVRLSDLDRRDLAKAAREDQRTMAAEIRVALREYLDRRANRRRTAAAEAKLPKIGHLTKKELQSIGAAAGQPGRIPAKFEGLMSAMSAMSSSAAASSAPTPEELGALEDFDDDLGDGLDGVDSPVSRGAPRGAPADEEVSPEMLKLIEDVRRAGFVQGKRADE